MGEAHLLICILVHYVCGFQDSDNIASHVITVIELWFVVDEWVNVKIIYLWYWIAFDDDSGCYEAQIHHWSLPYWCWHDMTLVQTWGMIPTLEKNCGCSNQCGWRQSCLVKGRRIVKELIGILLQSTINWWLSIKKNLKLAYTLKRAIVLCKGRRWTQEI